MLHIMVSFNPVSTLSLFTIFLIKFLPALNLDNKDRRQELHMRYLADVSTCATRKRHAGRSTRRRHGDSTHPEKTILLQG